MWLRDPKNRKRSVSLSLLAVSFVLVVGASTAQMLGLIENTGLAAEIFYSCCATYFGRRIKFKGADFGTGVENGQ